MVKVFVYEDKASEVFLFKEALKELRSDVEVIAAIDWVEVNHYISQVGTGDVPVLFLVDLNLRQLGNTGIEVVEMVRSHPRMEKIPIVLWSSYFASGLTWKEKWGPGGLYLMPMTLEALVDFLRRQLIQAGVQVP